MTVKSIGKTSASSAERGDEATTLLVIENSRMFQESKEQVRWRPHCVAKWGRPLTLGRLFRKARALLARVAPVTAREHPGVCGAQAGKE